MSELFLIRHTTPAVNKGICYGQTDLDITDSFHEEADLIRRHLPDNIQSVHSSPLRRCALLAEHLFPSRPIVLHVDLMEIHCGEWEMKSWDELPKEVIDPWMKDFVRVRIPGGESYLDLHERVTRCFEGIRAEKDTNAFSVEADSGASRDEVDPAAGGAEVEPGAKGQVDPGAGRIAAGSTVIVAHGGVIRSILSYITDTPLIDSFKVFSLHYGCVIRVFEAGGVLQHEILSNSAPKEKEQHKPSGYYK